MEKTSSILAVAFRAFPVHIRSQELIIGTTLPVLLLPMKWQAYVCVSTRGPSLDVTVSY
jgi:hypothetical protein